MENNCEDVNISLTNFNVPTAYEYECYMNRTFVDDGFKIVKNKVERISYLVFLIIFTIYAIVSLVFFYKLRRSYIIRQRGFLLTFIGGILAFINVFLSVYSQIWKYSCLFTVISANVINIVVNLIFLTRSLRVILNYHFNIFKVSSISKRRNYRDNYIEPNHYLLKIYKRTNKIIAFLIIFPTIVAIVVTILIYLKDGIYEQCSLELQDVMYNLKRSRGEELFYVVIVFGNIFMVFSFLNAILLFFVKDANKYGVKFECITVSILVVIFYVINVILQSRCSSNNSLGDLLNIKSGKVKPPRMVFLAIYEKTKGGKILFAFLSLYMMFVSITLPVIHYYKAKHFNNNYFKDQSNSLQYFYRVLNTPSLVNELKNIAIKEFSVENVLFWENYQILQKMVYRYQVEYNKAKELGNEHMVMQYNFDAYYQQVQQNQQYSASMDEYSYDPNMQVPREIMKYYVSFYTMFIDFNGPASVNLTGKTIKRIINDICIYPTVGMFDQAKNEVVEMMYTSIYPILLRDNKKHISNTLG